VRSKLHQYRPFFVILVIMTIVWFVMEMTSSRTYKTSVAVTFTGIDTARYAILDKSQELPLTVESDGFTALIHNWTWRDKKLEINLSDLLKAKQPSGEIHLSVAAENYKELFQNNFSPIKSSVITFDEDSLSVTLSERMCKAFVPEIRNVTFTFSDGFGISGTPMMSPDTVYLYGSERSLTAIDAIYTRADTVKVADSGGFYKLSLFPVWNEYPDLRVSQTALTLQVPVEPYFEDRQTLKVQFISDDTEMRVKLYPENVVVTTWVPQSATLNGNKSDIHAVVRHDKESPEKALAVTITDFPKNIRIKSVEPDHVQYVIIK